MPTRNRTWIAITLGLIATLLVAACAAPAARDGQQHERCSNGCVCCPIHRSSPVSGLASHLLTHDGWCGRGGI